MLAVPLAVVPVPSLPRRLLSAGGAAGVLASAAGAVSGRLLAVRRLVPGVAGAAAVSVCAGELAGHVFGHGLAPWVAGLVGGVFALALDRRLP